MTHLLPALTPSTQQAQTAYFRASCRRAERDRRVETVTRHILSGAPIALQPPVAGTVNYVWCMDALRFLRELPDETVDMILTSPPYDNLRAYKGFSWDFEGIAQRSYQVLKQGGVLVWVVGDGVVGGSETLTSFRQALYFKSIGFRVHQTLIFHDPGTAFPDPTRYTRQAEYMFVFSKGKPKTIHLQTQPNRWAGDRRPPGAVKVQRENDGSMSSRVRKPVKDYGVMGNVWTIGTGHGKSTADAIAFDHPAMFPEELARRHIATWTGSGDLVLDYFMGSGTTAKVARAMGRHYIGCDIAPDYVSLARERLRLPFQQPYVTRETVLDDLPLFAGGK